MLPEQAAWYEEISIHALREEGDFTYYDPRLAALGISIHALREEGDRLTSSTMTILSVFLSTPSARRATAAGTAAASAADISIHALREEGDVCQGIKQCNARVNFYPRPPRGGRRA